MRSFLLAVLYLASLLPSFAQSSKDAGWPEYGGDNGGQRYSTATEITPANVTALKPAWVFHTHALQHPGTALDHEARFEATPVLWEGKLYFDSPFDTVFAVDATSGRLAWTYDPKVDHKANIYILTARGVTLWHDPKASGKPCADRVFVATLDKRLIAMDARNGQLCQDFGDHGTVDLSKGIYISESWLLEYNSPPVVVGNKVILGSSVGDNQTTNAPSGEVRAFDVHTGKPVWSWQPVRWDDAVKRHIGGAGNAWAPLSADPANDLVFVPTGSAALDYYGATRLGDNRDADSIVALRASTGQKVWSYQLVHHDLWDYDTASQPLLFTFRGKIPAVAVTNKTGMLYVFNRLTGEPLYSIEERPVPRSNVPGEVAWPTQPFSTLPPIIPHRLELSDFNGSAASRQYCSDVYRKLTYKGLFTPPEVTGTVDYPSGLGGPNWGSSAFDPRTGIMYTRASTAVFRLFLVKKENPNQPLWERIRNKWNELMIPAQKAKEDAAPKASFRPPDMGVGQVDGSVMRGVPYRMFLQALIAPDGTPCAPAPYGRIVATDLNTGKQLWSVAHGSMGNNLPGAYGWGGSLVTASQLIFSSSTTDPSIRAYHAVDGKLLWKGELPATANATPMTYSIHGRQFVVIASGGHWAGKNDESDSLVAFALPPMKTSGHAQHGH